MSLTKREAKAYGSLPVKVNILYGYCQQEREGVPVPLMQRKIILLCIGPKETEVVQNPLISIGEWFRT